MLPSLYRFRQLCGGFQRWQNPSIGKIHQTLSVKSTEQAEISQTRSAKLAKRFALGWSRCVTLLTTDDLEERRIYWIEAVDNGWTIELSHH